MAPRSTQARRGQPLLMLAALLGIWTAARATLWEGIDTSAIALRSEAVGDLYPVKPTVRLAQGPKEGDHREYAAVDLAPSPRSNSPLVFVVPDNANIAARVPLAAAPLPLPVKPVPQSSAAPRMSAQIAAGHQLLWMAALSALPLPGNLSRPARASLPPTLPGRTEANGSRWSGDGWLLLRPNSGGNAGASAAAALVPSYGASQIGAVIRYRLGNGSGYNPTLYVRATSAISSPRDARVAAGIALRPVAALPLLAMAELRGGRGLHPALTAVTALPQVPLPLAARAEFYAQAGYVAGGADATAFVDGQLRVDRGIVRLGSSLLRAGGGIWGGAQKGAARLDIGPSAALHLAHVAGGARLALDWRFRIAGDAAPRSGPALTLSAGF